MSCYCKVIKRNSKSRFNTHTEINAQYTHPWRKIIPQKITICGLLSRSLVLFFQKCHFCLFLPRPTNYGCFHWCIVYLFATRNDYKHQRGGAKLQNYAFQFLAVTWQLYRFPCHSLTDSLTHSLTATFEKHYQRALWETCDPWDILSEWWGDMTWLKIFRKSKNFQKI